ncbi:MAG: hypothetical protein IJQ81_17820 [Oscillibacter sp.]|nr:hypothetical protein [Oscillibacter sp.]
MEVERQLVASENGYRILLLGAKFAQECDLQQGKPVTVAYKGKTYETKMHSEQKGRVDGLTSMYEDFPDRFQEGDSIQAIYDPSTNTIVLS